MPSIAPLVVLFRARLQIGILAPMKVDAETTETNKKRGFHVRMPDDMRARIEAARIRNGRSANSEILAKIQAGLDAEEPESNLAVLVRRLKACVEEIDRLARK